MILKKMNSKKFTYSFIFLFVLYIVSIASLNYIVNPLGVFSTKIFPTKIKTVRHIKTQFLLENRDKLNYDLMLLGSSRTDLLKDSIFAKRFNINSYNFSFTCTGTEDYYCQLKFLLENKLPIPKNLIIGIDFFNFRPRPPQEDLKNTEELYKFINEEKNIRMFRHFFSFDVTKLSIDVLLNPPAIQENIEINKPNDFVYSEKRIDMKIDEFFTRTYAAYTKLNSEKKDYFEKTLALCNENNIEVIFFLTPMHPKHYRKLVRNEIFGKVFQECKEYLNITSKRFDMKYLDLSQIETTGLDSLKFNDSVHYDLNESHKIIDKLIKGINNSESINTKL